MLEKLFDSSAGGQARVRSLRNGPARSATNKKPLRAEPRAQAAGGLDSAATGGSGRGCKGSERDGVA
jgi:hypothetical protein